jgi:hypothetical protein
MQIVKRRGGEVGVGGEVAVAASRVSPGVFSATLDVEVGKSPPSDEQEDREAANITKPAARYNKDLNRNVIRVRLN